MEAVSGFIIRPLSTVDRYVHDHTSIKNYEKIARVVNIVLTLTSTLLVAIARKYEYVKIPKWYAAATLLGLIYFLNFTKDKRVQLNRPSVPFDDAMEYSSLEESLSHANFSFVNSFDDVTWEVVLGSAQKVAEKERKNLPDIFNQTDTSCHESYTGSTLFWRFVNSGQALRYPIARELLRNGANPNLGVPSTLVFENGEFLLFLLTLVAEKKVSDKTVDVIKKYWNKQDKDCREPLHSKLSTYTPKRLELFGWANMEALQTFLSQVFDDEIYWR